MVIIDTLRADQLGAYGYPRDTSPELDALAEAGVRFERVVSQSPWTRPSIGSMLTSQHPRRLGITEQKRGILADQFQTLAEILRDNGYRTVGATANPHLNASFNFQQGFDAYLDSTAVWNWMRGMKDPESAGHPKLLGATHLFDYALTVLDEEGAEERAAPHYLQFDVMEVHETWGENDLVRPPFKEYFRDVRDTKVRRYLQAIRQISADLDEFVATLSSRPGWEDVLWVIVSDHGEGLRSHPGVPGSDFHGALLYESHLLVPWILYSSNGRVPRGQVIEQPVRLLEVMPTVLELVGLELPDRIAGSSLVPLLRGMRGVELPEAFFVETRFARADKIAVYTDEWKYFSNRDGHPRLPRHELQATGRAENGAATDLSAERPEVVRQLSASLRDWEAANPRRPPTLRAEDLPNDVTNQLRSLGYTQ